ncbi:uncharacterized protein LOC107637382 [Arachis ipaensis]|uniref:uncharacterized protein LOC107637382 n=1 Tax=Arachis ipaensis TaxID=130454 RepID=UPI0007AF0BC0|nr:uncharacterized protein LOC107637382 [Arachis ipaensis]
MEIYVDDMVAKTSAQGSHCDDLQDIFKQIRTSNMRLNPEKCAFGVQGGKFLGFMLTSRGIVANPEKCEAILKMNSPKTIKEILTKPELAGRLIKWSVELSEYDIQYQPRKTPRLQILADFIAELTTTDNQTEKSWKLYVDSASNKEGSGAGVTLKEGEQVIAEQSLQFSFTASNNQAEYEALLAGLKLAQDLQISKLTVYCDSLLVVQQIKGDFQVIDWRTPFLEYIKTGVIPKEEQSPQLFRRRASFYTIIGDNLYRRGFSQPLLKCINKDDAEILMAETHEGVCGNHIGGRALSAKILRTGYFWPTMKRDCIAKVKACDNCQKHATISTTPAEKSHTLEVSWPFDRWGLDILGPFPKAPRQSATGETLFKLVYGAEALILVEIRTPTLRAELYDQNRNNETRSTNLDLVDEEREIATIKQQAMKQLLQKRHNKRVIPRTFESGELVLRKTEEEGKPQSHGNLAANWEGHSELTRFLEKEHTS